MPLPDKEELYSEINSKIELAYKTALDKLDKRKEENLARLKEKLDKIAEKFVSSLSS